MASARYAPRRVDVKLPHCENAYVPRQKLTEYLLSEAHPIGKAKARFFRAAGFDETNLEVLEQEFLRIAQEEEVVETTATRYGAKFVVEGVLATPNQEAVRVRTVWIIEPDQDRPRFVTAYPH